MRHALTDNVPVGGVGEHHLETEFGEKGFPHWEKLVEEQDSGDAYRFAVGLIRFVLGVGIKQCPGALFEQVRYLGGLAFLFLFSAVPLAASRAVEKRFLALEDDLVDFIAVGAVLTFQVRKLVFTAGMVELKG